MDGSDAYRESLKDRESLKEPTVSAEWFPVAVPALEGVAILTLSYLTGVGYHLLVYAQYGPVNDFIVLGGLAALWFIGAMSLRGDYELEPFIVRSRGVARTASVWTAAFAILILAGFLTKTTDQYSRGWLLLFYLLGLGLLTGIDFALHRFVRAAARGGRMTARRVLLVGTKSAISDYMLHTQGCGAGSGCQIASTIVLPHDFDVSQVRLDEVCQDVREAVRRARSFWVTDVLLLFGAIDKTKAPIVDEVMELPAEVHVGGLDLLDVYPSAKPKQIGGMRTLSLAGAPLTFAERLLKWVFDFVLASVAFVLALPVFGLVALAIKLDSAGPVLFTQRRRGFNSRQFRIFKFRTMSTMDDGETVVQAMQNDARVTRVGRVLRKTNLDELPQLINVLRGEMSLVGPRPHAVAHDQHYGAIIRRYGRRLNVKPGITGWAQVNGFRGPTKTSGDMRKRVLHDLYYVNNWSIAFDVQILVMTLLNRDAYRNAF